MVSIPSLVFFFCKDVHKDKSMTCKVYKELVALKMYSTYEKSDHGELNTIAKKCRRII